MSEQKKIYRFDGLYVVLSSDNTLDDWNKIKKAMDILLKVEGGNKND